MFKNFSIKIANIIAPEYIRKLEERAQDAELKVNKRVAEVILNIDPFDILRKEFHGIFSEEFEHPEEKLDERSKLGMMMWAYQQKHDPHFKHMVDWIMNSAGNETLKRAPITTDRVQYGRAQISTMVLYRKEIGRLSSLYEEILEKNKPQGFDSTVTVEA